MERGYLTLARCGITAYCITRGISITLNAYYTKLFLPPLVHDISLDLLAA